MKAICTLLFQVVFLVSIYGQNMITSYSENDLIIHRYDYVYDDLDSLIEKVYSSYYKEQDLYAFHSKTQWTYENDKLISTKRYQYIDDDWFLKIDYSIFYNDAGCVDRQEQTFHIRPGESRQHTLTLVNEYDCADPWKNTKDHLFLADSPAETIVTRRRTDSSEIEIYDEYDEDTDAWINKGVLERKYNEQNKLTEFFKLLTTSYVYATKYDWFYDNTGENLMTQMYSLKHTLDGEWDLSTKNEYIYDGLRVKKTIISDKSGRLNEILLDYYCDGLLKSKTGIRLSSDGGIQKYIYEYDRKITCPDECEQLKDLNLIIYPNPVKNCFYIQSDIFQKASSEILIYDMRGNLIQRQQVVDRVPQVLITLNQNAIPNQIYIVHLISEGGYSISKKFMIEPVANE